MEIWKKSQNSDPILSVITLYNPPPPITSGIGLVSFYTSAMIGTRTVKESSLVCRQRASESLDDLLVSIKSCEWRRLNFMHFARRINKQVEGLAGIFNSNAMRLVIELQSTSELTDAQRSWCRWVGIHLGVMWPCKIYATFLFICS